MKIYITVDMEGISGINTKEHVLSDARLYGEARRMLTEDVNAAVRGAFNGGADEVIVMDAHGGSNNILTEQLDERALLLIGTPRFPRMPFLNGSDGLFLLGYHAQAGTERGALEHTMTSMAWHKYLVNGVPFGEIGIDADIAGWEGVPVVLVSGDDKACDEAHAVLGAQVETACVKQGVGRQCALCLAPSVGRRRIEQAAERAVRRLSAGEHFPLFSAGSPVTIATVYKFTPDADAAMTYDSRRIDGYTVERDWPRLCDAYGGLWSEHGANQRIHLEEGDSAQ